MGPNIEQIMLLLQRRYNALREISRLTEELQEAISCSDQVSASLLMEMRADEMAKVESCQSDIWLMAENKPEYAPVPIPSPPIPPAALRSRRFLSYGKKQACLSRIYRKRIGI